jgi:methionyl-tRNA formyltransferase
MPGCLTMTILLLGPNSEAVANRLKLSNFVTIDNRFELAEIQDIRPDFVISFGYRFIINTEVLDAMQGRVVNIHISLLPWNRGSDPNLWSWLENTPSGVSLHWVSEGLDKGHIVSQMSMTFAENETLRTTYGELSNMGLELLAESWSALKAGAAPSIPQSSGGSYHKASDKDEHLAALRLGWDTPVGEVREYGRQRGLWRISTQT